MVQYLNAFESSAELYIQSSYHSAHGFNHWRRQLQRCFAMCTVRHVSYAQHTGQGYLQEGNDNVEQFVVPVRSVASSEYRVHKVLGIVEARQQLDQHCLQVRLV